MNNNEVIDNLWQQALYNFLPDAIEFFFLIVCGVILLRTAWLLKQKTQLKGANLMYFSLVIMGMMMLCSMIVPIIFDMNEDSFDYLTLLFIPLSIVSAIGFYQILVDAVKRYQHEF